jgi:hypothetical protein
MNRTLVFPRDLFNDAKLLKSLGKLALIIHDGLDDNRTQAPDGLAIEALEDNGWKIEQDEMTGNLSVLNISITYNNHDLRLCSSYNCKDNYSLWLEDYKDCVRVLDPDKGTLTEDFIKYLATLDITED